MGGGVPGSVAGILLLAQILMCEPDDRCGWCDLDVTLGPGSLHSDRARAGSELLGLRPGRGRAPPHAVPPAPTLFLACSPSVEPRGFALVLPARDPLSQEQWGFSVSDQLFALTWGSVFLQKR